MITKEHLTAQYTFYRFPNMHIIFLVPLLPSLMIVFFRKNLYEYTSAPFGTVSSIIEDLLYDYFLYFKVLLSVVAAFVFVYRWSQIKVDKSYGYWITQGVDRYKFVIYIIVSFSLLCSISEWTGLLVLNTYLGFYLPFLKIILITITIIFSNLLFTIIGLLTAELIFRPEIAGLVFLGYSIINYGLLNDETSLIGIILKLENNFGSELLPFAIFLQIIIIGLLSLPVYYMQKARDILT